jgi:uncharacterized protein (DUF433 family)
MSDWQPAAYRDYKWIVHDPDLLGGKLAVRGTRLSVSFVLACLGGRDERGGDRADLWTIPA